MMSGSHITITLSHSTSSRQVTVFFIHVVNSTTRLVAQPNTVIFDRARFPLKDPVTTDNLSSGFLQFSQLTGKVPESRFRTAWLRSKDPHLEKRRLRAFLGGQLPPNHFVLFKLTTGSHL